MVVSAGVISNTDEDKHMLAAVEDVKESFDLDKVPGELLLLPCGQASGLRQQDEAS